MFQEVQRVIGDVGKSRWKSLERKTSSKRMPGYYGHFGKEIIIQHFLNLVRWKFLLPSFDIGTSIIHPLSIVDFILNILLPEASIRLIMQDKGWNGGQPMQSSAWDAAWKDANQA
ncbi:MAG: hypothetical protein TREMPRED_005939 [Tremellales sp. Tagirdzhanova-0007]|nr:MAG: hypothetical protein TREMPRED_005939 [Tremellales sp. Tagirdzhanova-0007]